VNADQINTPELSQTLCCALQIALVNLLGKWGVKPSAVIGHSSGEIAASYAAGAITAESAIALSYYRGLLVEKVGNEGSMAAVGLGRVQVASYLRYGVVIACENSPNSVTLSGEPRRVEDVINKIKSDFPDALCRMLRVNRSYHSGTDPSFLPEGDETKMQQANQKEIGSMAAVGKVYETSIRSHIKTQDTMIPMYSSVTGQTIVDPKQFSSNYWVQNLVSPVLFWGAAESVMQDHARSFFLEIGPHSALAGPLRDIHKYLGNVKQEISYASCLIRGQCQETALLTAAGELFLGGIQLKFEAVNGRGKLLTDLDPYPWQSGEVEWSESRITREWRRRKHAHHELLGSQVVESTQLEPSWRNMLHIDDAPWLWDHCIGGSTVFPCAGYIVMAGEAMRQISGSEKYRLRNLRMSKALTLDDRGRIEILSNFRPARPTDEPGSGWFEFSISSFRMGSWVKHCTGQVRSEASSPTPRDIRGLPRPVTSHSWYENLRERGLEYGSKFRLLQHISAHPTQHSATASLERDGSSDTVDAPTIDQCLQLVAVAMSNGLSRKCDGVGMPVYIQEVFVGKAGPDMFLEATASGSTLGRTSGSACAQSSAEVGVKIDGVEFMGFDEALPGDGDQKLCSNLVWAPDVDLVPEGCLLTPCKPSMSTIDETYGPRQQFFDMCIIETARLIAGLEPASEHLRKYQNWMATSSAEILKKLHSSVPSKDREFLQVPRDGWIKILTGLKWQIDETMPLSKHFAELSLVVLQNCSDIVQGRCQSLGLLIENDGLSQLYNTGTSRNYEGLLRLLGHSQPDLQIIEIGAGTGATTARALQCLHPEGMNRQYSRYVFTDISSAFFQPAMERFKRHEAVEYAVLDISQPPVDQEIEPASFDLVIASNVSLLRSLSMAQILTLLSGTSCYMQHTRDFGKCQISPQARWTSLD
jgi:malonyl CoA-acyl carrier protein transacylase